jgi:tripartite-type tricarboxylate transporter receptor subunit TctC
MNNFKLGFNFTLKHTLAIAGVTIGMGHAAMANAKDWEPTKSIEFIVPFGAGGATDNMARAIQGIIAKHKLVSQPIIVQNKAGAGGAEGLLDIKSTPGDAHRLVVSSSGLYTVPLATGLDFNWRDLTPVAMVAQDEFILWVNSDTPYKTPLDYLAAVKKEPGKFKMGGTSSKREDHIITAMVEKAAGVKFTYIPYKGGGEAATQLSGKHIDSNPNNPSESIAQWRAGQHRALCLFADKRSAYTEKVTDTLSWADVPGKVAPEVTKYYTNLMQKVVATPEWKEYVTKNALKSTVMVGDELRAYLGKDEQAHRQIMKAAGFMAP